MQQGENLRLETNGWGDVEQDLTPPNATLAETSAGWSIDSVPTPMASQPAPVAVHKPEPQVPKAPSAKVALQNGWSIESLSMPPDDEDIPPSLAPSAAFLADAAQPPITSSGWKFEAVDAAVASAKTDAPPWGFPSGEPSVISGWSLDAPTSTPVSTEWSCFNTSAIPAPIWSVSATNATLPKREDSASSNGFEPQLPNYPRRHPWQKPKEEKTKSFDGPCPSLDRAQKPRQSFSEAPAGSSPIPRPKPKFDVGFDMNLLPSTVSKVQLPRCNSHSSSDNHNDNDSDHRRGRSREQRSEQSSFATICVEEPLGWGAPAPMVQANQPNWSVEGQAPVSSWNIQAQSQTEQPSLNTQSAPSWNINSQAATQTSIARAVRAPCASPAKEVTFRDREIPEDGPGYVKVTAAERIPFQRAAAREDPASREYHRTLSNSQSRDLVWGTEEVEHLHSSEEDMGPKAEFTWGADEEQEPIKPFESLRLSENEPRPVLHASQFDARYGSEQQSHQSSSNTVNKPEPKQSTIQQQSQQDIHKQEAREMLTPEQIARLRSKSIDSQASRRLSADTSFTPTMPSTVEMMQLTAQHARVTCPYCHHNYVYPPVSPVALSIPDNPAALIEQWAYHPQ